MARTTGPLMSLGASGKVAKTIVFSHWKGRPYVRELVTPANPRSTKQRYSRAMIRFLSTAWASITTLHQASWATIAKAGNFSNFNAYTQTNRKRWTQSLAPAMETPIVPAGTHDVLGAAGNTPGVGQIVVTQVITTKNNDWGYCLVVDPTNGATPPISLTEVIANVEANTSGQTVTITASRLKPGTYSVAIFPFTDTGLLGARASVQQGIIVT